MAIRDLLSAILTAFGFIAWAVWGKKYQIHPVILGVMSSFFMALTVIVLSFSQLIKTEEKASPFFKLFLVMVFLYILNGVAFYSYSQKVATLLKTGDYIAAVSVFMLIEARFLDWYLNQNSMSVLNIGGLFIAIIGIIFLMR